MKRNRFLKVFIALIVLSAAMTASASFFYHQIRYRKQIAEKFYPTTGNRVETITRKQYESPIVTYISPPREQIVPTGTLPSSWTPPQISQTIPPVDAPVNPSQKLPTATEIGEFTNWASAHGITLQAVTASVDDMYYNRYDPATHNIALEQIPGLVVAFAGLKKIPDSILITMQEKTIYFSTINERPYTNLSGDYGGTLKNTKSGFILTQALSESGTVHELGHIVGYHGIEGIYGFTAPFSHLKGEYDILFDTAGIAYPPPQKPKGYISSYATANKAENFAEHFAYYIVNPNAFRAQMAGDDLLIKKYNFFKDKLFQGKEY